MTFFATMVLVQVVVLPINAWLLWRVRATNELNRAELAKWDALAAKDTADLEGIEALLRAQSDLVALQLAIRLQAPRAYW